MIFEWRIYRFAPGRATEYLASFEREGLSLVTRHLPMLGYWLTECGELNTLHHLWVYRDLADRAARRVRLAADDEWTRGFGPRAFPMIEHQRSRLLEVVAGSPRLDAATAAATEAASPPPPASAGNLVLGTWSALETGRREFDAAAPGMETVAIWRVLAGEGPGDHMRLTRAETAEEFPLAGRSGHACDLMRPARFSPLR